MAYRGSWVLKSQQAASVPLVAPIDPEHLQPTGDDPNLAGGQALWVNGTVVDTLPGELTPDPMVQLPAVGGPVDTTPEDPSYGVGYAPGLTTAENQELRTDLMSADHGAVAAHQYTAMVDRDGAPHVAVLSDTPGNGDSPSTLELKRSGVGTANDPYARVGRRIQRWYDRYIDFHRYDVEQRPLYLQYATTQAPLEPVGGGNQLTSPYGAFNDSPTDFTLPQERRTPAPWDQALTTDGTGQTGTGVFGLGSWGL